MSAEKQEQELKLKPELAALEAALAALRPKAAGLDRDRLMYLAGQAAARAEWKRPAGRRTRGLAAWFWPCAAAASLALALGVGWYRPRFVEHVVYVERPAAATQVAAQGEADKPSAPAASEYLKLRELVLLQGVNALPAPPSGSPPPDRIPIRSDAHPPLLDRLLGG